MITSDRRVLLVRPVGSDRDAAVLAARGVTAESDAYLTVAPRRDEGAAGVVDEVLDLIADDSDWLIVTSQAAPQALASITTRERLAAAIESGVRRGLRSAAVGPAAAASLTDYGATDVVVPAQQDAEGLLAELLLEQPATAVLPVGNQARTTIPDGLRANGWTVDARVVYVTAPVAARPTTADRLAAGEFAVVVLRSPSAARAVGEFAPALPAGLTAVCGGRLTATAARSLDFARIVVSDHPSAEAIADAVESALADDPTHDGSAA